VVSETSAGLHKLVKGGDEGHRTRVDDRRPVAVSQFTLLAQFKGAKPGGSNYDPRGARRY
jgi:hypothetical protein